jgi:DNA-binding GntR family transcriptional regulator
MATDERETRRPLSKVEYVLERLREDIRSGVIPAGTSLRQQELARRYGVSATPVREALRLLEADGNTTYSVHRGMTVAELTPKEIYDLYRLRASAESSIVSLAEGRLTDAQKQRIIEAHDRLAATEGRGDAGELSRLNKEFHFSIYEAVSPVASNFVSQLWSALPRRLTIWQVESQAAVLLHEHRKILDAIVSDDYEAAAVLAHAHVMTSEHFRQAQRGA